jgi:hypothetical protein
MRGLWQNRVRIFLSQMATRVEFSDSTRAAGCYPIGSSRRSKMSTGSPKYIDIRSLSGKCHPRLDPVTDQRSIACHPGLRSGISSFKRYLRTCPTADVLFILAKRSKTSVTNVVTGMYFMVSRSSNLPAQLLALGIRQDMW